MTLGNTPNYALEVWNKDHSRIHNGIKRGIVRQPSLGKLGFSARVGKGATRNEVKEILRRESYRCVSA